MTDEKQKKALEIFSHALYLPESERESYIAEACAADEVLLEMVKALQYADASDDSFIEKPVFNLDEMGESYIGKRIGSYRVSRLIGRGGMGNVYFATRDDEQYHINVAIKVIKRGMDTDEIIKRFQFERQILASLKHPYIVPMFDGNVTDDGLPYFVMEYIDGQPLDIYCDTKKLNITDRLKLFLKVCRAVQHAHRNLIVHRDLKPGNILITGEGEPKLLDFGIAKLLRPDFTPVSTIITSDGAKVMTPEYASPEQVKGDIISTASDVYSLGVILYELLTGHSPYQLKIRNQKELEDAICEQEPEKPSTAITRVEEKYDEASGGTTNITAQIVSRTREGNETKLRRRLKGDIDNIVLKALNKEPEQRYGMADNLADDIQRHLNGLPVLAQKPTLGYRTKKFIKRYKFPVAAAVTFFVLILTFTITTLIQSNRIATQAKEISLERDKAEKVSDFLINIFASSDPGIAQGDTLTSYEILKRGAKRIKNEFADQPEIEATLLLNIGIVYKSLANYDSAIAMTNNALDILRKNFNDDHKDVAKSIHELAELAVIHGDYEKALSLYHEALSIRLKFLGKKHIDTAESYDGLARLYDDKGDFGTADSLLRLALEIRRKHYGEEHEGTIASMVNLASVLENKAEYLEAESLYRNALKIQRKIVGNIHPGVAIICNNLAGLLSDIGNYREAEELQLEALSILKTTLGEEHPALTGTLHNLANLYDNQGKYDEAERLHLEALSIKKKQFHEGHISIANSLHSLAGVYMNKGEIEKAEMLYNQALEIVKTTHGENNYLYGRCIYSIALLMIKKQEYQKALPLLHQSSSIFNESLPPDHWLTASVESTIGDCLVSLKHYEKAEPYLINSFPRIRDKLGLGHERTIPAINRIIKLYKNWNKHDKVTEYEALLEQAQQLSKSES